MINIVPMKTANGAVLHVNSCVYELMQDEKGETTHLTKQINNAIPVTVVSLHRYINVSAMQLENDYKEKYPDAKVMFTYPYQEDMKEEFHNWTVVSGTMITVVKADPYEPIVANKDLTPEQRSDLIKEALEPKHKFEHFMLCFPESDEYMFDITFSHVPAKAVKTYDSRKAGTHNPDEEIEPIPAGIDPNTKFISPEDRKTYDRVRTYIEKQINAAVAISPDGKLPDNFQLRDEDVLKASGLDSMEELKEFRQRMGM